jgi:serine phosphatase RsbU (regulator of sigma subunit)
MKIRTSLVLACFVLSVLPLGGIVVYSYYSSRSALESAYHAEAGRLTAQMERRLGNIREMLNQRLAEVSALPNLSDAEKQKAPMVGNIMMAMGDAAPLFHSLELWPTEHAAPKPAIGVHRVITVTASSPTVPEPPAQPIVIDIPPTPKLPRFVFTGQQREYLKKISELGPQLGQKGLTPEERDGLLKQLKEAQTAFGESMKATQQKFQVNLQNALKARDENMRLRRVKREADRQERERERAQEHADAAREAREEHLAAEQEAVADAAQAQAEAAADAKQAQQDPTGDVRQVRHLSQQETQSIKEREKQTNLLFGHRFAVPVTSQGAVIGHLQAQVSAEEVVHRLLATSNEDRSEITFAVDREGNLYTRTAQERQTLDKLGVPKRIAAGKPLNEIPNWIVVQHRDADSGLRVGVARPVGEDLEDLRKTAARNFGYGIALIFVALIGITPIANHITRDVEMVTRGAERIAHGDLTTRIPAKSSNEIGHLARAFNRMAEDLSLQQQQIVEQERAAIEYERKSAELEEARRFQLSMLPKEVPHLAAYDIAVFTHTATEVGGDYYDFHVEPAGAVLVTIGDATGHGARAGTMVAVIKALFSGYHSSQSPAEFLREATEKVRRMDLARMAMALQLARFEERQVTIASAGMPPAYIHRRATGAVEEIAHSATPLGTMGDAYKNITLDLAPGDTLLFMSDGFPELMNATSQQLGYPAASEAFAAAATAADANGVIAELAEAARRWHGEQPPNDDVTFVVVRVRT